MYNIDKQSLLLRSDRTLFHTQDLALLWSIENRNTLYTTIKRYVEKGVLIPVVKGLYSVKPIDQIDTYVLGSVLIHKYCYVSCETVLADTGVINQDIIPITFVSSISLKVKVGSVEYLYRQVKPEILFDSHGVEKKNGYFMATKDRAIRDMLYFNPKYYLDNNAK